MGGEVLILLKRQLNQLILMQRTNRYMFFKFCLYFFLSVIVLLGLRSISKLSSRMCFSSAIGLFFLSLSGFIIKWWDISSVSQKATELPYISESFKKNNRTYFFNQNTSINWLHIILTFFRIKSIKIEEER